MGKKYLIWSFEHDGWWKENGHGYTQELSEAGTFYHDEALEIVESANKYCVEKPNEALLIDFRK